MAKYQVKAKVQYHVGVTVEFKGDEPYPIDPLRMVSAENFRNKFQPEIEKAVREKEFGSRTFDDDVKHVPRKAQIAVESMYRVGSNHPLFGVDEGEIIDGVCPETFDDVVETVGEVKQDLLTLMDDGRLPTGEPGDMYDGMNKVQSLMFHYAVMDLHKHLLVLTRMNTIHKERE
jgi:hypothetical protein